jgi:hypothetical protein
MTALTREEWDLLTPAERKQHAEDELKNIYGANYKTDPKTKLPVEDGVGSLQQPTEAHWQALLKAEGLEIMQKMKADAVKRGVWPPKRSAEMF